MKKRGEKMVESLGAVIKLGGSSEFKDALSSITLPFAS